jgi:hypothetical protein
MEEIRYSYIHSSIIQIEYRVWNPYRSKIAAAVIGGVSDVYIRPGSKVLYLGAASGTTVSHVSDIIGAEGIVYAVEFSHRSGRDLVNLAKKRTNIVPLIMDARKPLEYRSLVQNIFNSLFRLAWSMSSSLMLPNPIRHVSLELTLSTSSRRVVISLSPSRQTALIVPTFLKLSSRMKSNV